LRYGAIVKRRRLQGEELEAYLARITGALRRTFSAQRIVLFGSFARGDQNRASDLDVVVIADTNLPFCDRIGLALRACSEASRRLPVEVLVYTPVEWDRMVSERHSFARLIEREGRILHDEQSQREREPALAAAGPARS
jgi:predicted nucleotidyltransferase